MIIITAVEHCEYVDTS